VIYQSRWGTTSEEEKRAFEWFVDLTMSRWAQYPAMHVFHYAPYEPSALKRLMGRYATREDKIDRMLRAGLLIDLHAILKQAVRASVEEYSLKALEVFHQFGRAVPLEEARRAMHQVEHGLELGRPTEVDEAVWKTIQGYNADDCLPRDLSATGLKANGELWSKPVAEYRVHRCPKALLRRRWTNVNSVWRRWWQTCKTEFRRYWG